MSIPTFLRALRKEPQWPAPITQQKLGGSSLCAGLIFNSQQCSCLWGGTAVPAECPALRCHISKQESKMQLLLWEYSQDFGAKNTALQWQESCQDLKKLMVRCCAIALNFFPGISRKLLPVIFPFCHCQSPGTALDLHILESWHLLECSWSALRQEVHKKAKSWLKQREEIGLEP